jgi:hypothetical protein
MRIARARELAGEDLLVGATHRGRSNAHERLPGSRPRVGYVSAQFEAIRRRQYDCFHAPPPPARPFISSA